MKEWKAIEHVLEFAIEGEEQAIQFYTVLANRAEKPWMKNVFESFADEERGHKAKLQSVMEGKTEMPAPEKVQDLKIGDYLVDVKPTEELDYQEALVIAMKREKAAFRLYNDLAKMADDEKLKQVFLALAQEEAKHKLQFEVEYDENILTEN